ncbi:MAG TPA: endonuclease/exonuclease/phosphatase family protein [Microbacterium sp.]|nr:endonuclease/exonuclease/phosphatase family protein [Microbacterium sp.]
MMTDTPLIGPVTAPDLHVMTFNIRRRIGRGTCKSADGWRRRRPRVQSLLHRERPTLVGVQEALPDQARAVSTALGESYQFVGHGRRADAKGEGCPLFYDAARLELVNWAQEALSDRPDEPGSRSWGNLIPRVFVRAEFRDRMSSVHFIALNTHFDPLSRRSRVRAAERIRDRMAAQDLPVIVTGDLNASTGSPALRALLANGTLADAWDDADRRLTPAWNTYRAYREPRVGARRIDWIAVSRSVRVLRIGINARRVDGGWPSDHLPVQAVVRLPERVLP